MKSAGGICEMDLLRIPAACCEILVATDSGSWDGAIPWQGAAGVAGPRQGLHEATLAGL